jgi:hypothetical protein
MIRTFASIEAEVLSLPDEPRLELLQRLLRSFYAERPSEEARIARIWNEEAARRDREMETGEDPGIPAEELFAQLRSSGR